jgi:branched-chain amino acid transport system permease protein
MTISYPDEAGRDPGHKLDSLPIAETPRRRSPAMTGLAMGLGLAFMPWGVSTYVLVVATHALILGIASTGVNLLLGYTGLLSLGHAAFFGLGAYAGGLLYLFGNLTSFESYLLSGVAASTLLAALLGFLCVRVTRIYFTILTLVFTQMVYSLFVAGIVFRLWGDLGKGVFFVGEGGLYLPRFTVGGRDIPPETFSTVLYYIVAALFLGSLWLMWRIVNSPFGMALRAIRDNETRAVCLGIRIRAYRWAAFVISGLFVGLAGGLAGELDRQVTAEQLDWLMSAQLILASVVGGTRHFLGPAIGAVALTLLEEFALRSVLHHGLVLGVLLIVVVFVSPGGIAAGALALADRVGKLFGKG